MCIRDRHSRFPDASGFSPRNLRRMREFYRMYEDTPELLALAMEIQQEMNSLWPGLARPITLRTARFNQQLTKGSLLVEVGAAGNSPDEAELAGRLFAQKMVEVLEGRSK